MKLRISSLAFSFATLIVHYQFIKKHFSQKMALSVAGIASLLFLNIYYSYMSRGYELVSLCFILSLFCAFTIIKEPNPNKNWVFLGLFSVIGFFTVPTYLYPFISLNCFIVLLQRKTLWKQLLLVGCVLLIVFLLYLPIIYANGLEALTNNTYVKPLPLHTVLRSLPKYYLITLAEITGIHWVVIVLLLLFSCYLIFKTKNKTTIYFTIIFIATPLLFLSVQRVLPYARVFTYYNYIIVLLVLLPLQRKIDKVPYSLLLPIILTLQIGLVLNFNWKIYSYEDKDNAINITAAKLIPKILGNHKYLMNDVLLPYNLEFELKDKGYTNYSIKETSYKKISADTISDYDYVVLKKEEDCTKNKQAFYKTDYYTVYSNR
jgi:4-amino-4-deoxy-L-arabinose transferase-like glycosyltransferase